MILKSVRKNKIKTFFIVAFFLIIIAMFIYFVSLIFFESTIIALTVGIVISILISLGSYYNSDKIVLKLNNARIATKEEFQQLNLILEGLCIAANIPVPKLYIIDDEALNAFATGRNPQNAVICVTSGLLNKLDKYELEGVIAHELSHIKNYDILLATIAVVMVGFVVIIADIVTQSFFYRNNDSNNKAGVVLMVLGLLFIALAPLAAELMKLAISRNREYLADANAVEITRNKDGLINALKKITDQETQLKNTNKATSSLYIANPLKTKKQKNSLWSTHPNVEKRIMALENIK
ncbi:MAG: M48 family metallopeptidase [Bacilli bacterium]